MTIRETFEQLKSKNEMALIAYQTAGHPDLETSMKNIQVLAENGADIIELGIPFSDPIADGPTIQVSSQAALENGVTLTQIIEAVSKIEYNVPLVAMSYLNPLMAYGKERLFRDMKEAGFSGVIIPDLPLEETGDRRQETGWAEAAADAGIDLIFLVTPTTSEERLQGLVEASQGFVYCVSLTGITGVRTELPPHLSEFIGKVKSLTDKPAAVGFGISTPEHVQQLKSIADGVIVGSRIVKAITNGEDVGALVRSLKEACRA
jgi:tryptophan synthase alpha chain